MSTQGKVLVIDDDPDFVEFMRIVLETGGYQVFYASNAQDGLALLRTAHPDIVLLDIMMSYSMEGLDVTQMMREDQDLRSIPLVIISSVFAGTQAFQTRDQDLSFVAAFLTKPVEPQELLRLVAETIASRHT
jgi:CheY-like chemotaxis protein